MSNLKKYDGQIIPLIEKQDLTIRDLEKIYDYDTIHNQFLSLLKDGLVNVIDGKLSVREWRHN